MTLDANERGKLMIGPRVVIVLFGAVTASIIKIVTKMSQGVVSGYKAIETGVVKGYTAIEDGFVEQFLMKPGETLSEAKARLKAAA